MNQRKLALRKENLAELATGELGSVAGASGPSCNICPTACTSCASDFQQCLTGYGCIPTANDCVVTVDGAC